MKTFNWKRAGEKRFNLAVLVFALVATLGFTACGNSGGGSSGVAATVPAGVTPCTGCPGNMGYLTSALGQSVDAIFRYDIELGLDFFMDVNVINQYAQYGNMLPGYGAGSVVATGVMNVVNPSPSCPVLPLGSYTVQTIGTGTWGGVDGRFFTVQLNITGPVQLQGELLGHVSPAIPAAVDHGGKSYPYRFMGYYFRLYGPFGVCYLDTLLQ